jgi:hypothetical protein
MTRLGVRLVALLGAAVAMLALSLAVAGVANADRRTNYCDVTDSWGGPFEGGFPGDQGVVVFDIFNQVPPAPSNNDGSEDFALLTQLASGLGNAGEGDKYHFRWVTTAVTNGATASGHGFVFVLPDSATFVIAGHGEHPLGGTFKLDAQGDVFCGGPPSDQEGYAANAMFHVEFNNQMISEDDGMVTLARCEDVESCEGGGD